MIIICSAHRFARCSRPQLLSAAAAVAAASYATMSNAVHGRRVFDDSETASDAIGATDTDS